MSKENINKVYWNTSISQKCGLIYESWRINSVTNQSDFFYFFLIFHGAAKNFTLATFVESHEKYAKNDFNFYLDDINCDDNFKRPIRFLSI